MKEDVSSKKQERGRQVSCLLPSVDPGPLCVYHPSGTSTKDKLSLGKISKENIGHCCVMKMKGNLNP